MELYSYVSYMGRPILGLTIIDAKVMACMKHVFLVHVRTIIVGPIFNMSNFLFLFLFFFASHTTRNRKEMHVRL